MLRGQFAPTPVNLSCMYRAEQCTAFGTTRVVAGCVRSLVRTPLAAQMLTAVDHEIPVGPPDIPKLLAVLDRHGVTVAA